MQFKFIRCPFKTIKSKHVVRVDNEICIDEKIDFGFCDTNCIYCEYYKDINDYTHFQKCKRIDK